jgi:uncharacterized repeat protein (TIGR01451 family)
MLLLAWGAASPARAALTIIDAPVPGPITINAGDRVEIHTGGAVTDALITVKSGGELIVFDGSVSKGVFMEGGTMTMSGGSVTGGVLFGAGGGTLDLSGGSISGSQGVLLNAGGTANISGGTVAGSSTSVYMNGGLVNISGGTITGTPNANNLGVQIRGGLANLSGGSISGRFCGVLVDVGGVAVISGSSVAGTPGASNPGGHPGVSVTGGTANLSGGSVSGSVGVQVTSGTATLTSGTVSGEGNGLKVTGGAASISGGSISGTLFSDISVSGGTATVSGCNLLLAGTTLLGTLKDGMVINMPVSVSSPGQLLLVSDAMQITCPANQTALATSAAGAVVTYPRPLVSNTCGGPVTVTSEPASGSTFPVGITPVTCTVTDIFGNSSSCSFTVTVQPAADLALSISAASDKNDGKPLKVNPRKTLTYTIVVNNGGPNAADNVGVQDILPDSFVFESATTTQGTLQAPPVGGTGTLTANLGTLAASGSATVRISGHFRERKSTIPNTASVSTGATDPNPANNQATVNVVVN